MGKATIKSHIAAGQYSVDVVYDSTRVKTRLAFINSLLNDPTKLTKEIADAQAEYNTKKAAADEALAAMNAYIETPGYSQLQLLKLSSAVIEAKVEAEMAQRKLNVLKLRKTAMEKEKAELTANAPDTKTVDAWCADLTTSLSGDVGTVEIDYETTKAPSVIILPGHAGALTHQAPYNGTRDGILHHPHDQSPHQMYTNRAYLPASAKWKPRYRVGTITVLAGNSCNIELDAAKSSQLKLDINQDETLLNVPIKYMTCNGGAFAVGDRVVVAFDGDWATPTVIGFESNPKACPIVPPAWSWSDVELKITWQSPLTSNNANLCNIFYSDNIVAYGSEIYDYAVNNNYAAGYVSFVSIYTGETLYCQFKLKHQQTLYLMFDMNVGGNINNVLLPEDTVNFVLGPYSATLPALTGASSYSTKAKDLIYGYILSGGKVYDGAMNLVADSYTVHHTPRSLKNPLALNYETPFDPALITDFTFTMNYSNPPDMGSTTYNYKSHANGSYYWKFKKQ